MYRELALRLAERFAVSVRELLGERLVSAALFGSLATDRFREESDIDLLFVAEGFTGVTMGSRITSIMPAHERLRQSSEYAAWVKEFKRPIPDITAIIYTPEEVKRHPPILLDLVYDAKILYDTGFLVQELEVLRKRLKELGAKRYVLPDGTWYWRLKPDIKRGEVVEI